MAPKKQSTGNGEVEDDVPSKIWKANPPGPEQKESSRMFQQGIINASDTPAKVRSRNQMFTSFPPKTLALHFRTTKAKLGLNAVATTNNAIPELSGFEEDSQPPTFSTASLDVELEAKNFPYMVWSYKDHLEQNDIVCVVIPTVAGSRDIKFVISDDGMQLTIEYVWPTALFNPAELFYDVNDPDEEGSHVSMSHPMVYAYRVKMDELDWSAKSKPGASLTINLPLRVQRELGTFTKQALKCGDSRVVMMRMTAYQKKRVIVDADTSFKF